MKKIFLSLFLLSFTIGGFCQPNKPVKIDSLVSISFPPGYQKKDTAGEQIFTANGMYGYIIAIREANAKGNTPLKKEKDLNKVLKDYIKGIRNQTEGSAAENVRDTTIGTLKAKAFELKTENNTSEVEFRNFVLLYTQDATYTFEYAYPASRKDLVKDEYKSFIGSIKLSPQLQRNDQYLSNAKGMSTITKIEVFGGAALIIILVIVFIVKRRRRVAIH